MKSMITENFKSLSLAALLIASATFVACSGDDNITEEQPVQPVQPQVYTMTVDASKGGDAADSRTTRALSLSGSTLNATWATTEHVYVKKGETWATGSLQPQADGATATLKGTLSGITISADDNLTLQFPKSGDITYAGQTGTLADIAANFDYATASVEVESISASGNINPKAATTAFTNQQAIIKFTLQKNDGSALPGNPTAFTVSDGTSTVTLTSIPADTYTPNGNGVLYVAFPAAGASKTVTLTAIAGAKVYSYTKTGVTFTNGKYYAITVKMKEIEGAIPGQFTVSSTGTKVYFSKGNLQAKISSYSSNAATASEWKFADNQYNCIGNAAGNTSFDTGSWVDLFSWVGNSADDDTYGLITFTSNSQANHGNVSGESLKTDWGTAAAPSIGSGWRTLTKDEWVYLINVDNSGSYRQVTVGSDKKAPYGHASVNGVNGLVLLPDGWDGSVHSGFTYGKSSWSNVYTESSTPKWSEMESAGCVFLPAAGYRLGTDVGYVGDYGHYWSSTAGGSYGACLLYFDDDDVYPDYYDDRCSGFSVRLVQNLN